MEPGPWRPMELWLICGGEVLGMLECCVEWALDHVWVFYLLQVVGTQLSCRLGVMLSLLLPRPPRSLTLWLLYGSQCTRAFRL